MLEVVKLKKSIISMTDLTPQNLEVIFEQTRALKARIKKHENIDTLSGQVWGLLFEKPSTRTRTSFQTAVLRLNGEAIYLPSSGMQLSRGEPVRDTARILGGYLDGIIARVYDHKTVVDLEQYAGVPVINGLSDLGHPTQIVCDLFTLLENKGTLQGLTLTFIGDGNNVCNSLLLGTAMVGMNMNVACPKGYEPDMTIVAKAQEIAAKTGAKITIMHDPIEAARGADVLYTDVWVSMGEEAEKEKRLHDFKGYQINAGLLKVAAHDAVVMHCLPAHRGLEITDDVIEGPQSIVWQQGENKLYGAVGILSFIQGVGH